MIKISDIAVPLDYDFVMITNLCSKRLVIDFDKISSVKILKKSVNIKNKDNIHYRITVGVCLECNENEIVWNLHDKSVTIENPIPEIKIFDKKLKGRPVVVGSGPAGLFAALILAKAGVCPIIIERGEAIENRKVTVSNFWENKTLNPESNVQFGEGGAGTFSDGKLKIGKKDETKIFILNEMIKGGAPEEIDYLEKPHIGTDKLYNVVKYLRNEIISLGGEIFFNTKLTGIDCKNSKISGVHIERLENDKIHVKIDFIQTDNVILAIGNSARDTFEILLNSNVIMEQRPIAVGLRIEHEQKYINRLMYGENSENLCLCAADYKLVTHLPNGRSVYSFCMCPGGYVIGASSLENSIVTNGMSGYKRNAPNANSALLVSLDKNDYQSDHPLAAMYFQQDIERKAFIAGGGNYFAPIQKLSDFMSDKSSKTFGTVTPSYKPGVNFNKLESYLPHFITDSLRQAIKDMNDWMPGFEYGDAILTGAETRSSSPVKILRNDNCQAIGISGLYPCGEGAGYSGGIISAAVDGIKCANALLNNSMF